MSIELELPPPPPPPPADDRRLTVPDAEFNVPATDSTERVCPNCGAPVHGPFCYACGQSEKGMIRHLTEVLSDLADIVLNVDSRIFRSLWDLYIRPGFLTTEYLAGRRARYVTPFRLFFFLTIIAFIAMQASIDPEDINLGGDFDDAATAEEVSKMAEKSIAALTVAKNLPGADAEARSEMDAEIAELVDERNARVFELALESASTEDDVQRAVNEAVAKLTDTVHAAESGSKSNARLEKKLAGVRKRGEIRRAEVVEDAAALAAGKSPPERKKSSGIVMDLNGKPWHPKTNPMHVDWWPEALNQKLNSTLAHMEENIKGAQENKERLASGLFSVLPQTLFVVMPLFAILLKIFYVFKRRLYMEHLLVALHSHAFIFMSVLVILFLSLLAGWAENSPVLLELIEWLRVAAWVWLFVYLLIMQKRVYRQGWVMTVMKYCVIGLCYTVFLSFALVAALAITLAIT
ncbi:DUF3667 domain-containing protein [Dokdonella sp.]|uniref:DUF3667 domain-containing protein n=1 Tax=Dokdonella sp. TaxID=2291710 RepID=UPI003529C3F8